MSRIDELFTRYVEAHRASDELDPVPYLREVSGAERDELAALIDRYLAEAPPRAVDPADLDRLRADPRFQQMVERVLEPSLAELRAGAELSRRELATRLADELGLEGHEDAIRARYHELESGLLDPGRIAPPVWDALSRALRSSAQRLQEIAQLARQVTEVTGGPATVYARRAGPASQATIAQVESESGTPARDPEVDAAFFVEHDAN